MAAPEFRIGDKVRFTDPPSSRAEYEVVRAEPMSDGLDLKLLGPSGPRWNKSKFFTLVERPIQVGDLVKHVNARPTDPLLPVISINGDRIEVGKLVRGAIHPTDTWYFDLDDFILVKTKEEIEEEEKEMTKCKDSCDCCHGITQCRAVLESDGQVVLNPRNLRDRDKFYAAIKREGRERGLSDFEVTRMIESMQVPPPTPEPEKAWAIVKDADGIYWRHDHTSGTGLGWIKRQNVSSTRYWVNMAQPVTVIFDGLDA